MKRRETCIQDAYDNAFSHISIIQEISGRIERLIEVIPASSCMKLVKAIRNHVYHTRKFCTYKLQTQINEYIYIYIKLDKLGHLLVTCIIHVQSKHIYKLYIKLLAIISAWASVSLAANPERPCL